MNIKNLVIILFCITVVMSCSESDDPSGPIVGGPTTGGNDGGGDGGNNNGGNDGGNSDDPFIYTPSESLKDIASFPIGMIVSANKLASSSEDNETFKSILNDDFNSITAEYEMKMANMFTGPDTYDFSDGDAIVAYAKEHSLRVHGHALLWHQSIPGWLNSFDGTDEAFATQVGNYVKETVAHFAEAKMTVDGKEVSVVQSWDVVNEAFDGSSMRSSLFKERLGDDYVAQLFQWAREADPDVKLFYNDYNIAGENGKRNAIINMVNNFIANDIPIDGIGLQMHVNHDWPSASNIASAVSDVVATGLLIHFSELDVKVNYNNDLSELTEERAAAQEEMYKIVSQEYSKIPAAQQYGITIWGLRDVDSWLYDGGTEWPLMYDNDFNYKIAHRGFAAGLD